ncbi:hypothetical protein M3Y99_00646400 [Aphelenchoides fujianensis]|nr:hypothetical protein M3Y99_00646400 [Aphelenchoides fujianensis]
MTIDLDSPIEPTAVSLRWVLDGLDNAKYERWDELRRSSSLSNVSCKAISGAGLLSDVLRVHVRFENGEEFTVILKAPTTQKLEAVAKSDKEEPSDQPSRITQLIVSYHNAEIRFYEQFGRAFRGFPLPRLLAAERSTLRPVRHGQLLLEDVGHLGAIADNRRGLNFEQCKGVMRALADFHAFSLLLPDSRNVIEKLENFMSDSDEEKRKLCAILQKLDPFFVEHKAEVDQLIRENHAQPVDPHKKFDIPPVLAHGDVWTNNIFFKRNADGTVGNEFATILDWQSPYPGTGLEDVATFICTSADATTLRDHEEDLFRLYWEELNRRLKEGGQQERFTFEKMLEIYRFHRRNSLLFATFVLAVVQLENGTPADRKVAADRLRVVYERVLPELKKPTHSSGTPT